MIRRTATKRDSSRKFLLPGLTAVTVLAVANPLGKAYAVGNAYDWVKQSGLDKLGGEFTSTAVSGDGNHVVAGT